MWHNPPLFFQTAYTCERGKPVSEILIYQTEDGRTQVNLPVQEHTVWLNQSQLAELFDTSVQNIGLHIKNIFEDNKLDEDLVIKDFLITAADRKTTKSNTMESKGTRSHK